MAAGSEALVLKVSADTSDVQAGLAPMTASLDKMAREAADAEKELRALSDVGIDTSGIVKMEHALDNLEEEVDATRDAMKDLDATDVKLDVKDEAIRNARERIDELREQLAKEVTLGVSTKDTERQLANLQSAVKKLTDTPAVMDVDVDISDEELAGVESLREGALGMGEALGNAGTSMQSFSDIGREAVPLLADLNTTMLALRMEAAATGTSMGRLGSTVSKVTTFMAGPWGLAIAAGVGLLAAFASKADDAEEATADWTNELDRQAGAMSKANREKVAAQLNDKGLLTLAEQLGVSTSDLTAGLLGSGEAMARVNDRLNELSTKDTRKVFGQTQEIVVETNKSMVELRGGISELANQMDTGAEAADRIAAATGGANDAVSTSVDTVDYAAKIWRGFGKEVDDSRSALDAIISSIDILNGRFATVREATSKYEQAVDDATAAIKENGKAVTKHGEAFDTNSKKGRDNEKALIDMAKAAEDVARARLADADASGESTADILADYEKQRTSLIKTAERMGLSEKAAKEYVDELLGTPEEVATQIALTGYTEAKRKKDELAKDQKATVHVELQLEKFNRLPKRIQDAISGNGSINLSATAPAAPAPTPRAGLTLLQPRLYLDGRPIRAALRNDVQSTVAAQLAATRTRGRL